MRPKYKSILVVDDNDEITSVVDLMLKSAAYEVKAAHDCETARESLRTECFDVVLTDLLLGTDNGMDVVRAARELQPDAHIVIMSGAAYLQQCVSEQGGELSALAGHFLEKPFSKKELLAAVDLAAAPVPA